MLLEQVMLILRQTDNADNCSACGGNGQLLCCDYCTRAYHFTCLDPPISADLIPVGEFLCPRCAKTERKKDGKVGLFTALLANTTNKVPAAFTLPFESRDYFEGVKTGDDGEYEEFTVMKAEK